VSSSPHASSALRFRVAFYLVAALLTLLVITLPLAIRSLANDLYNSVEGTVYPFGGASASGTAANHGHISIVDLDESRLKATIQVSGHRVCPAPCSTGTRIYLFSLGTSEDETAGMPPSATVDIPVGQFVVTANVDLPVHGHPTLYPFDTYFLTLGVGLSALAADGRVHPLTRQEASGLLVLTIQELLAREEMAEPRRLDPSAVEQAGDPIELQGLVSLQFTRPLHERVLAVLLVLLVAAAAAYAVFMRPLNDLVINSGGLVLGVWGIRSILSPGTASRTLVDLSLSMVILFLLSAITFRALQFLYERGEFRRPPPAAPEGGPPAPSPPSSH
jgi:hypothetical protein